ncbi:WD repeat-containing protein 86-like isoform X2 [Procambarus clarkii]|uniref:WD repeat-containing protein 86 isoform X2 n=1 Tax=Procambarus clarkii TaxID=6728 RepID=UPI001E678C25|nr:WD repeat-containing protein 86-like isoform X2 [Procambarus clarkii]
MGSGSSKRKEKGHLLEALQEHRDSITCLVLSEDGSLMVTGSYDTTACMWSTLGDYTECLGVLTGHTGRIMCAATSRTFVFTGSEDATVRKWDMCSMECIFTYVGHMQQVHRIICAGDFLFSTSYDKTAKVWFLAADSNCSQEEACIRTFEGHSKAVYPILFIPGQDTGGLNEEGLNINPADLVITGSTDATARSWSLDLGVCIKTFSKHTGPISCMDTGSQGKLLYTGSNDSTIRVWDISSGRCLKVLTEHKDSVTCLKVVNRLLYSGSQDSKVKCWVREVGDCTRTYKTNRNQGSVTCIKLHRGILFAGYTDNAARAFDAKSGTLKRIFQGHIDTVNCLAVLGTKLYTAGSDGAIMVWDASKISDESSTTDDSEDEFHKVDLNFDLEQYLADDVDPTSRPDE